MRAYQEAKPKQPLENALQQRILAAIGALEGLRVWRNNTGSALVKRAGGVLAPMHFGLKGSPDIIGIVRLSAMTISANIGRFFGLEVKRPGEKQTPEQMAFERMCRSLGGFYRVVHNEQEALAAYIDARAGRD